MRRRGLFALGLGAAVAPAMPALPAVPVARNVRFAFKGDGMWALAQSVNRYASGVSSNCALLASSNAWVSPACPHVPTAGWCVQASTMANSSPSSTTPFSSSRPQVAPRAMSVAIPMSRAGSSAICESSLLIAGGNVTVTAWTSHVSPDLWPAEAAA